MQIHNYSAVTGEYLNTTVADESPLEAGIYLIPAFATDINPPTTGINQVAVFNNGKWLIKDIPVPPVPTDAQLLEQAQAVQIKTIGAACASTITGGFTSSALGKLYTYPSNQTDQSNLAANVLSSMYPNLLANWTTLQLCADSKGVWDYRPHAAAQIQQVGSDGKAAIMACLTKNAQLQAQIKAATNVAAVQQIVW